MGNLRIQAGSTTKRPTQCRKMGKAQCENFMIFLPLRFYVKSVLENVKVQNLPFYTFRGTEF